MTDRLVQREAAVPADGDDTAEVSIALDVLPHDVHQVPQARLVHPGRRRCATTHFANPCSFAT